MILQINFNFNMPVAEYQKMAESVASGVRDVPGLRWKIWLLNPASQEAGGIYLFESQAALNAYLNGPIVARLRGRESIRNISIKQFEAVPAATALTRGPMEAALTSDS